MGHGYLHRIALALLVALCAGIAVPAVASPPPEALLKPPLVEDPRRAAVGQLVRTAYPELFSAGAAPGWVAITLLLEQGGTLHKGYKDETRPRPYITSTSKAFEALGAMRESYGDRVQLELRGGTSGATRIYVRAWLPRPAPGSWQSREEGPAAPNDDPVVNRAIAEKYFFDLYTYTTPPYESVADFWVLLGRTGAVQATGRRYSLSAADLKLYLESLYPGIRTDGFQPVELRSDHGRPAVVGFTWLAADSPVTELSQADVSRRGDVAFYANITGDGATAETTLAVSRFGAPSVAVCDERDLDLQVTATEGGAGTVILRASLQRVAPPDPATFEYGQLRAVPTAWPRASAPVRVRLGQSVQMRLTDQAGKTWLVALHPDRLRGSLAMR